MNKAIQFTQPIVRSFVQRSTLCNVRYMSQNSTDTKSELTYGDNTYQVESKERQVVMCPDGGTFLVNTGVPGPKYLVRSSLDPYKKESEKLKDPSEYRG